MRKEVRDIHCLQIAWEKDMANIHSTKNSSEENYGSVICHLLTSGIENIQDSSITKV